MVVILLFPACQSTDATQPTLAVRDSAGIEILETIEGETPPPVWRLSAEPILQIGTIGGDPVYEFGRITGLRRSSDGSIFLSDLQSQNIRVFRADGTYLRTVGREGAGPGEFRRVSGIALRSDTLLVFDSNQRRVSAFDREGQLVSSTTLSFPEGVFAPVYGLAGVASDGRLVVAPSGVSPRIEPVGVYWVSAGSALRFDRSGTFTDSIGEPLGADMFSTAEYATTPPFGRFGVARYHADQFYAVDGGSFEVRVYRDSLTPSRIFRLQREIRPVTPELIDLWREERLAGVPPEARAEALQRVSEIASPETVPWISGLAVDAAEHLWVREFVFPGQTEATWWIFAPDGRLSATVNLPHDFRIEEIGRDYLLGVGRDDLDVEYARMYALTRS